MEAEIDKTVTDLRASFGHAYFYYGSKFLGPKYHTGMDYMQGGALCVLEGLKMALIEAHIHYAIRSTYPYYFSLIGAATTGLNKAFSEEIKRDLAMERVNDFTPTRPILRVQDKVADDLKAMLADIYAYNPGYKLSIEPNEVMVKKHLPRFLFY